MRKFCNYVRAVSIIASVAIPMGLAGMVSGAAVPASSARVTIKRVEPRVPFITQTKISQQTTFVRTAAVKTKNHIEIPKIHVDTDILEGATAATLNRGLWHLPGSSTPDQGGNVVISGHRYKWLPPSTKTFWDLDKLVIGDPIIVTWKGSTYTYVVKKISIVKPNKVEVLDNTPDHKLTLFTCTPKFTSKYRLIVEAYPQEAPR